MAEKSNTSPNQKEDFSYVSNPLSPQEIESLRQDMNEAFKIYDELSEKRFQKRQSEKDNGKPVTRK